MQSKRKQPLTLVVLAAGMGSRYGGLKQLDAMGPSGETVLDYSVYDALRAGFSRVLFVIRREFAATFESQVGQRFASHLEVAYACQELDKLPAGFSVPEGRTKPWGTAHAVWCARDQLDGPFAVVNADDFYGQGSFACLAAFLDTTGAGARSLPEWAMVGFRLANTLSEHGAVSRGVCTVNAEAYLSGIVEQTGIQPEAVGTGKAYDPETVVSMNCWGFTPDFLPLLDQYWQAFIEKQGREIQSECYLPTAVNAMVAEGKGRVRVLPTGDSWFGVTYREDKARVQAAIVDLIARGSYPSPLFC